MNELRFKLILLFTLLVITLLAAGLAYGEQKYNAAEGRWETVAADSELRFNSFKNEWSYQQPGARLEYSPSNGSWNYAPPPQKPKHSKPRPKSSP